MEALCNNTAQPLRYWCQDETRVGLKTLPRRVITAPGVKPIGTVDWQFEASWLDGAVAPLTGDPFFLELPHADRACFQAFLDHFAHYDSNAIHVLQLDQARFHLAKRLYIPDNILLLLQPPHSPETNPIERLWQWIKDQLAWQNFPRLDDLKQREFDITICRKLALFKNQLLINLDHDFCGFISF